MYIQKHEQRTTLTLNLLFSSLVVVLLLLYIQTTHIHVADGVAISPIVRPSILKSSGYHHSHPNQTSARVRTPGWNSVRLFASRTATYLPMSVGLDGITQSTNIALTSSVPVYRRRSYSPVEILSASKDGNIAQKTETLRTNSALAAGGKSVRESRLNSDNVTAAVREKSTQSSHVVAGNITQSYYSNFSGKTDTSASFVQQRTRTAKIVRTASAILQAKPSSPSHTKADLLPSSSFKINQGKSEIYHTNASQRKSFLSTAQISKHYQEITPLSSGTFRSSASLALCSEIGDACSSRTNYMRTILTVPHNIATSLSQSLISYTYEVKIPAASGHVSYLSRDEHSTLGLTNNFNQSQVHASLIFTLFQNTTQSNPESNLKTPTTATSSLDIIPITRASQTPRLFNSISYNMITTSSQSMSHGLRSLILEQHSSQGSEDRKTEVTFDVYIFIVHLGSTFKYVLLLSQKVFGQTIQSKKNFSLFLKMLDVSFPGRCAFSRKTDAHSFHLLFAQLHACMFE